MELPNRATKDPYQEIPIKDFSYVNTSKNEPPKKSANLKWVISGLVILVLLGVGAFAYGHYTKTNKPKAKSDTHKTVAAAKTTTPNIQLTNYSSGTFNLTVNYPTTWTVTSNGNTSLNITSPVTTLTTDSGKSVQGREVVSVFNQGQLPAGFGTSSVAVLNSQDINYTSPSTTQAAQTYISFVQYPATTVIGGLDAIYLTGNDGYLKDQTIPNTDVNQISPLVVISFQSCQDSACSSPESLTISSSMWGNIDFQTPIMDVLKSFVFS